MGAEASSLDGESHAFAYGSERVLLWQTERVDAMFEEDGQYYEAEVVGFEDEGGDLTMVRVLFVAYGNEQLCAFEQLRPICNYEVGDEVEAKFARDEQWYGATVVDYDAEFLEYTVRFTERASFDEQICDRSFLRPLPDVVDRLVQEEIEWQKSQGFVKPSPPAAADLEEVEARSSGTLPRGKRPPPPKNRRPPAHMPVAAAVVEEDEEFEEEVEEEEVAPVKSPGGGKVNPLAAAAAAKLAAMQKQRKVAEEEAAAAVPPPTWSKPAAVNPIAAAAQLVKLKKVGAKAAPPAVAPPAKLAAKPTAAPPTKKVVKAALVAVSDDPFGDLEDSSDKAPPESDGDDDDDDDDDVDDDDDDEAIAAAFLKEKKRKEEAVRNEAQKKAPVEDVAVADEDDWMSGEECEAKWAEDNAWYKALIIGAEPGGTFLVEFTEYGNLQEGTSPADMRRIGAATAPAVAEDDSSGTSSSPEPLPEPRKVAAQPKAPVPPIDLSPRPQQPPSTAKAVLKMTPVKKDEDEDDDDDADRKVAAAVPAKKVVGATKSSSPPPKSPLPPSKATAAAVPVKPVAAPVAVPVKPVAAPVAAVKTAANLDLEKTPEIKVEPVVASVSPRTLAKAPGSAAPVAPAAAAAGALDLEKTPELSKRAPPRSPLPVRPPPAVKRPTSPPPKKAVSVAAPVPAPTPAPVASAPEVEAEEKTPPLSKKAPEPLTVPAPTSSMSRDSAEMAELGLGSSGLLGPAHPAADGPTASELEGLFDDEEFVDFLPSEISPDEAGADAGDEGDASAIFGIFDTDDLGLNDAAAGSTKEAFLRFSLNRDGLDAAEICSDFADLRAAAGIEPMGAELDPRTVRKGLRAAIEKEMDFKSPKLGIFRLLEKQSKRADVLSCGDTLAKSMRALVVGAGIGGLRAACELALLGVRVVVVEKRSAFTRNNVLHLWSHVVADVQALGAAFFVPGFCKGNIHHCAIRKLQLCLLRSALLLGVDVFLGVQFDGVTNTRGGEWRARCNHVVVSDFSFNVLIGSDGEASKVASFCGFDKKETAYSLALGITANFENSKTKSQLSTAEVNVARHFKQAWFAKLAQEQGIELENMVYYKDDTHYFVCTAMKDSLLGKGVLREDVPDLVSPANVNRAKLELWCQEVAAYAGLPKSASLVQIARADGTLQNDTAIFDFSRKFRAVAPVRVFRGAGDGVLWTFVIGDALMEPFWPLGTGANRAVLSAWDALASLVQIGMLGLTTAPRLAEDGGTALAQLVEGAMCMYTALQASDPNTIRPEKFKMPAEPAPLYSYDPNSRYARMKAGTIPEGEGQLIMWSGFKPNSSAVINTLSKASAGVGTPEQKHRPANPFKAKPFESGSEPAAAAAAAPAKSPSIRVPASPKRLNKSGVVGLVPKVPLGAAVKRPVAAAAAEEPAAPVSPPATVAPVSSAGKEPAAAASPPVVVAPVSPAGKRPAVPQQASPQPLSPGPGGRRESLQAQPRAVLAQLAADDASLEVVDLSGNTTFAMKHRELSKELGEALRQNTHLRELHLKQCDLDRQDVVDLCEGAARHSCLAVLDLEKNKIDNAGAEVIAQALRVNTAIRELNLLGQQKPFGDACLTSFVDMFNYNVTLTKIVWRLDSRKSFAINKLLVRNNTIQKNLAEGRDVSTLIPAECNIPTLRGASAPAAAAAAEAPAAPKPTIIVVVEPTAVEEKDEVVEEEEGGGSVPAVSPTAARPGRALPPQATGGGRLRAMSGRGKAPNAAALLAPRMPPRKAAVPVPVTALPARPLPTADGPAPVRKPTAPAPLPPNKAAAVPDEKPPASPRATDEKPPSPRPKVAAKAASKPAVAPANAPADVKKVYDDLNALEARFLEVSEDEAAGVEDGQVLLEELARIRDEMLPLQAKYKIGGFVAGAVAKWRSLNTAVPKRFS